MKQPLIKRQGGFTGPSIGVFVLLFFFASLLIYYMPTTKYHRMAFKWISEQLTTITGRPVHFEFHSFFDKALTTGKYVQSTVQSEDSECRKVLNIDSTGKSQDSEGRKQE